MCAGKKKKEGGGRRGDAADNVAKTPKFKLVGTSPIFKKRSDSRVRLLSNLFVFSLLNFIGPSPSPSPHAPSPQPL